MATTSPVSDEHIDVVDLFHSAWVKAFIRVNHAHELETLEILLSIGQQMLEGAPRRRDHGILDIDLATMLRAVLLAAKSADVNLRNGLHEPALAQQRTLLELDLSLEYMLADPQEKDRRAERYLAWSRKKRIQPLEEQLREFKADLPAERIKWIEGRLAAYRADLDAMPDAANQNDEDRNWHSCGGGLKGLARQLGRLDDYLRLYAPMSNMNVHAADPETHLNIRDGSVTLKALVTTEPHIVATALHSVAGHLLYLLLRLRDEWALKGQPIDRLLELAQMRFVGTGDGKIPAELHPEVWSTAIRVTQTPLGEILDEAAQLLLVILRNASSGLTEEEIVKATGLESWGFPDSLTILRQILDLLVASGDVRVDTSAEPVRYHAANAAELKQPQ